MRALLTEFIGTFFLVLTVALSVANSPASAPLAIGAVLMVMVYMGGHISGAHYNPAVSLAVMLRGKLDAGDFVTYVISQVCGAVLAASVAVALTGGKVLVVSPSVGPIAALSIEAIYTFALALVVLNAATAAKTQGNSYYGLAIGFTITAAAFAGGALSGGAFNPAVGCGAIIVQAYNHQGGTSHLWLYIVGPCLGAAVAALVFRYQNEPPLPAVPTAAPAGPKEIFEPKRTTNRD